MKNHKVVKISETSPTVESNSNPKALANHKLLNKINQQLKKPFSAMLFIGAVATGISTLNTKPASAYCVYNNSNQTITALQVPLSTSSFKAVIEPQASSCCPWKEPGCTSFDDGRYGTTTIQLYRGSVDLSTLNVGAFLENTNRTAFGWIPVVGDLVDGMYKEVGEEGFSGKIGGRVQTYNGGVVWYDGTQDPLVCWNGPCLGHDINRDGSPGIN